MINTLEITVLMDNMLPDNSTLASEHGLSLWIEADEQKIIMDTGQSALFMQNAQKLGIDIGEADYLVLSHGHYDHTGGLYELMKDKPSLTVFCHPGIFIPRYSFKPEGFMKPVGISRDDADSLDRVYKKIRWTSQPTYIAPDICITGPIPRITSFEDTGGKFFLDKEGTSPDPVNDDMAIWFRTQKGLVVLTGCCHSGLVNTLEYIYSLDNTPVHTIMGGFHLLNASDKRMESTLNYLEKVELERLIPCHCTGDRAVEAFRDRFGERCVQGYAGKTVSV